MNILHIKLYVKTDIKGSTEEILFITTRKMANCSESAVLTKEGIFQCALWLTRIL